LNGVEGAIHVDEGGACRALHGFDGPRGRRLADRVAVLVAAQRRLGEVEGLGVSRHGILTFERSAIAWVCCADGVVVTLGAEGASPGLVLSHATRLASEEPGGE